MRFARKRIVGSEREGIVLHGVDQPKARVMRRSPRKIVERCLVLLVLLLALLGFAFTSNRSLGAGPSVQKGHWHYLSTSNTMSQQCHPPHHQRRGVPKFHIYNPNEFDIFSKCDMNFLEGQYGVGKLFYEELFKLGINCRPEEADIFVVPALPVESLLGACSVGSLDVSYNHSQQLHDLASTLKASKWFRRKNGSDHVLISGFADVRFREIYPKAGLDHIMMGEYEFFENAFVPNFAVGYTMLSSCEGQRCCHDWMWCCLDKFPAVVPYDERQYSVHVVFSTKKDYRPTHKDRELLTCALQNREQLHRVPKRAYIKIHHPRRWTANEVCGTSIPREGAVHKYMVQNYTPCLDVLKSQAQARVLLSLRGDNPTTDRIINAFAQRVLIAVMSDELDEIVELLPFSNIGIIPWKEILLTVDRTKFDDDPVGTLIELDSLVMDRRNVQRRLDLLEKHLPDIEAGPRMVENILLSAHSQMKSYASGYRKVLSDMERKKWNQRFEERFCGTNASCAQALHGSSYFNMTGEAV